MEMKPDYSPEQILQKIAGKDSDLKAKISLIVIYSHNLVDKSLNFILHHQIKSRLPLPPDFLSATKDESERKLTNEEWEQSINNMHEELYDLISKISFRNKARIVLVGFGSWHSLNLKFFERINTVRNRIAHVSAFNQIDFNGNPIKSNQGIWDYFKECQIASMELDEYFKKMIYPRILYNSDSIHYFEKILNVRWFDIHSFVLGECEKRGVDPPEDPIYKDNER